jgi:hypothetical protein
VARGFLARWRLDLSDPPQPASFGEPDLRLANRGGARISAARITAILERREAIERALTAIAPEASLLDSIVQKYLAGDDPEPRLRSESGR